ncbi:MAG TPA: hypothetical protein VKP61_15075 [Candidatus Acidoferrum sp.]|nr:hypothetical protein [Candidatus Acidoferrum sp.]
MGTWSGWTGLSNFADTVTTDLGAFGVIGQPNVGGHQTTQVTRSSPGGTTTTITSSGTSAATSHSLLIAGAAIALVIGLFLLLWKHKL